MNDHARIISLALHEIKRQIHEVAVHSRAREVEPYVSLKTVDAIITRCIAKYSAEEKSTLPLTGENKEPKADCGKCGWLIVCDPLEMALAADNGCKRFDGKEGER